MFSYGTPANTTKKRLRVKRGTLPAMDLDSTMTYDTEGRNTAVQYPSTWNGTAWVAGPNLGNEFDEMGRLKKLTNLTTSTDIISATTYNAMGELLTMTGAVSESRTYNSIGQMTALTSGSMQRTYAFSSSQNNGKISSESDPVSGETVTYTYDSLNRLASATSSTPDWGQSFGYDGFGNLTTVSVTKGSAPSLNVSYNASTNRRTTDSADANGNILQSGVTSYDVDNRITAANIFGGTARYSYAPGNKRIWRGTWVSGSQTVDELTYYSAGGAKLCAYDLSTSGGTLVATSTGYYQYFGGKLLKNAQGYVNSDRLGSIGKYFPYGQERPSATANGKEKFATYTRDAETGLDYAQARYHSSGDGRFLSPDPFQASVGPSDPGSWNRYAYTRGDPVNRIDPGGLVDISITVTAEGGTAGDGGGQGPPGSDKSTDALPRLGDGGREAGGGDQVSRGSSPASPTISEWEMASQLYGAGNTALNALADNSKCADLFGSGTLPDGRVVTAAAILQDMMAGAAARLGSDSSWTSAYGINYRIGNNPSASGTTASARTQLVDVNDGVTRTERIEVTFNNYAGIFVTGSYPDRSATLLHEVGHILNFMFGAGTSKITQGDGGQLGSSGANQALVKKTCF